MFKDVADQYIFISSACVYDTSIPGKKAEDASKGFKDWSYSTDKWASEQYLTRKAAEYGINYTIVRPCITYDDTRIPYGIMPPYGYHWTLVERILNGKAVITWDGGAARWNMMRVEDFAVGVTGLVGNPDACGQAFNICGDEPVSWSEVLDTLGRVLGKEVKRLDISSERFMAYCPNRRGEIAGRAADAISVFSKAGISITYMYSFMLGGKGILVFRTDNFELARDTILQNYMKYITEKDLVKLV